MRDMWKGEAPFLKSDSDWDPDSIQQLSDVTSFSSSSVYKKILKLETLKSFLLKFDILFKF